MIALTPRGLCAVDYNSRPRKRRRNLLKRLNHASVPLSGVLVANVVAVLVTALFCIELFDLPVQTTPQPEKTAHRSNYRLEPR